MVFLSTEYDRNVRDAYRSLGNEFLPTLLSTILELQEKGLNRNVLTIIQESLEQISEVLTVFKRSAFADSLEGLIEPISGAYRHYELLIHDRESTYVTREVKRAIRVIQNGLGFENERGELVLEHIDVQAINALCIVLERSLSELSKCSAQLDLAYNNKLWTPEIIPDDVLIQLNEVSRKLLSSLAKSPRLLHELTPRKFEEVIAELLKDEGFETQLTPETRDGGRDILAYLNLPIGKILTMVECKKYSAERKVSVEPVRQLYGVLTHERATNAMLVTTSTFTNDAVTFVKSIRFQMSLKDYNGIVSWLSKYK